jgi:hypothetical protein
MLNEMTETHRKNAEFLEKQGDSDAAIFEKIRTNIAEVFLKMFDLSWGENFIPPTPVLKQIASEASTDQECSHRVFLHYLNVIPQNWKEELDLARRHKDADKEIKAKIKLETKDAIERSYQKLVEQLLEVKS